MRKYLSVINLLVLGLMVHNLSAQGEFPALDYLYRNSEIVIQGTVVKNLCTAYAIGIEDCGFTVKLDSIYKGNPRIDTIEDFFTTERYLKGDTIFFPQVPSVHYFMQLRTFEHRPSRGQCIVIFLHEKSIGELSGSTDNRIVYSLVDRYLGWQPSNYFLTERLSKLKSTQ